jgi:hydrogenase nickel incorporation protein HypA/HybF
MHEVSIAGGLLEIISEHCRKSGYRKIDSVNIKIGRASGIMSDALIFAFDTMKSGSAAEGAVLQIEEVPVGGYCRDCNSDFTVEAEYVLNCPRCGGLSFEVTSGREMDIVDMEVS